MKLSVFQTGIGIKCGDNKSITLGNLDGIYSLLNTTFSFSFNITFLGSKENAFFGGAGSGLRDFYIIRNSNDSRDGSLRFVTTDSSGVGRDVIWSSNIAANTWYNVIFVSSSIADGDLDLYVDGTLMTISSESTNPVFAPETNFDLKFGEAQTGVIDDFIVAGPIVTYDRVLTSTEISNIQIGIYPDDYGISFTCAMPNRGLNEAI